MRSSFVSLVKRFAREDRGASLVEYGVLVALISVTLVTVIIALGDQIEATFTRVTTQLTSANTQAN
jgi:pilus assembly protein Flp/PilA